MPHSWSPIKSGHQIITKETLTFELGMNRGEKASTWLKMLINRRVLMSSRCQVLHLYLVEPHLLKKIKLKIKVELLGVLL